MSNDIVMVRSNELIKRMQLLSDELVDLVKGDKVVEEYIGNLSKRMADDVQHMYRRLLLASVSNILTDINAIIQPGFKLDFNVLERQIILENNPSFYDTEDVSSAYVKIELNSRNQAVINLFLTLLVALGVKEQELLKLTDLLDRWYPEDKPEESIIVSKPTQSGVTESITVADEVPTEPVVTFTEAEVYGEVPVNHDDIGVQANKNYKTSLPVEEDDAIEKNEIETSSDNQVTETQPAETLVNGEENPKFRDFVAAYLNDHNVIREFNTLKALIIEDITLNKDDRVTTINRVREVASSKGMDKNDYTSNTMLELAAECVARNMQMHGKVAFRAVSTTDENSEDKFNVVISVSVQPMLTYLILRYDNLLSQLMGDKNLLEVVYHMFEFDKYKNILTSQSNISDFYGAVRTVAAIFSRHNWKMKFYENTIEIENPPLPFDTWTTKLEDIDKFLDRIINKVRSETDPERVIKLRDIKHSDTIMPKIVQYSLDNSPDFHDTVRDYVGFMVSQDISIGITTAETADMSKKETVILINRSKNRALVVLPNNVYSMTIVNGQVNAITTIDQYSLTNLLEWLYYFELNFTSREA